MTITFNELRKIKDSLPHGGIKKIAERLNMNEDTVRNYFGGSNYHRGESVGIHFGPGPDGGAVTIDDPTILNMALKIVEEQSKDGQNN
ncbi:MAG: DNA-binding protein [Bacteroidales bacterium]